MCKFCSKWNVWRRWRIRRCYHDIPSRSAREVQVYINVDHMEKERWGPPLVDYDWCAFCQALFKGIEGEDWREMYDAYKEMSRTVGVKKPQEAHKTKALWKMKAAKDAGEEYQPMREEGIKGRKRDKISTLGRTPLRPNWCVGQSSEMGGKLVLEVSSQSTLEKVLSPMAAVGFLRSLWEKPVWEGVLAQLGSDGYCVFAHSVHGMERAREVWAAWRALFLPDTEGTGDGARR